MRQKTCVVAQNAQDRFREVEYLHSATIELDK